MTPLEAENYLFSLNNIPRKEYMDDTQKTSDYIQRIQFFLDLIGNPEKKIPHYIHVTGTSGKGSVSTFLSFILQAAGKKVGLTISPHPTTLRERWQVNNTMMSEKEFVRIVQKLKPIFDEYARKSPYDMVSFFDITTIIALLYFAEKKVEWAVMEVGLGGRLDSTNVIPHKDIAIITNIGLDHTDILGDTKEKIAFEKAGIIKPGSDVFTCETDKKVLQVIEKQCKKQKVKLYQVHTFSDLPPKIKKHQETNASLCIAVAEKLKLPHAAILRGLEQAKQPLRMEEVSERPLIILDGAHNPDKIKNTVEETKTFKKNIHLVLGFSADKNIPSMIKLLATLKPKTIACTRQTSNSFRKAAHPKDIQKLIQKHSPSSKTEIFLDPQMAFEWSQKNAKKSDLLLVTGSIFLSGEIRGKFSSG